MTLSVRLPGGVPSHASSLSLHTMCAGPALRSVPAVPQPSREGRCISRPGACSKAPASVFLLPAPYVGAAAAQLYGPLSCLLTELSLPGFAERAAGYH